MSDPPAPFRDGGLFGLTVLAWGANYLFVRIGLGYAPPLWLAALRAGTGLVGVVAFLLLFRSGAGLDARARRDALLLGVPNTGIFLGLWFVAAARVPAGEAAVLIYTFPLQVALLSVPVLRRRLGGTQSVAIVGGFVGVTLLSQPWATGSGTVATVPLLELLGAAFSWALSTVLFQRRFPPHEMPQVNAYQLLGGSAVLLVAALVVDPTHLPQETVPLWISVLWLGLFGTAFAYGVWFFLLGRIPASTLAAYSFLVPLVALAIGAAFAGERLTLVQGVGVAAVLFSIYGVTRTGRGGT